jgi:hypothetical protein
MSHFGFQLFRLSIKRTRATTARWTALRYISSEPSLWRGVNCPSLELDLTPIRLVGPPEITHSAFIVNSYLDDAKDPIRDKLISRKRKSRSRYIYGLPKDPCREFYVRFTDRKSSPDVLQYYLELSWHHCPQITLEHICLLRRTSHYRKRCRENFYIAALWLHRHHSLTLAYNLKAFAEYGCLKDLLEILYRIVNGSQVRHNQIMERNRAMLERRERLRGNGVKCEVMQEKNVTHLRKEEKFMMAKKAIERYIYDPKYRFLHIQISRLFVELLKADLEYLISGQLAKISLASKWCPSLDSSYDRSTLFCESVARRLFPYDSCPEYRGIDEAHYAYRVRDRLRKEVLVPLRRALGLVEIYTCSNQWNLIQYDQVTPHVMRIYRRLFYKHDRDRFLQHFQNVLHLQSVQGPKTPKTTTKELLPYEILSHFDHFFDSKLWFSDYDGSHEVAELQWKRMIDNYSSKKKFVNCITIVDDNYLFRAGYGCDERFCLAFQLMTSELCGSPWRGKVLTYTVNPEFLDIKGDDLGSRIHFLRFMPFYESSQSSKKSVHMKLKHIQFLDKILETAINLKLSKENMIERVFIFDLSGGYKYVDDWERSYGTIREKYERNGYVLPKIVRWDLWYCFQRVRAFGNGLIELTGSSEANFRIFLESDGILDPTVEDEPKKSKIWKEDYPKLMLCD